MEDNNWVPVVGQKVISLVSDSNGVGLTIHKDKKYTVESVVVCAKCGRVNVALAEIVFRGNGVTYSTCTDCISDILPVRCYIASSCLAPIPPAYENVSHELAQEAMKDRIEVDVPMVVNN